MCKNHEPSYISPRMVGQLYRLFSVVFEFYCSFYSDKASFQQRFE